MIKDGGLSFETQLKIDFLPPDNSSKKSWKNPWYSLYNYMYRIQIYKFYLNKQLIYQVSTISLAIYMNRIKNTWHFSCDI